MLVRYVSDLHLEFGPLTQEIDSADILILAGDITVKNRVDWINNQADKFGKVIYVMGNHEFYKGDINRTPEKTREVLDPRIAFLENDSVTVNGVTFHGATLWSDFLGGRMDAYGVAGNGMNDFRLIRKDYYANRFTPMDAHKIHNVSRVHLQETIKEGDVVITHHAPSFKSVPEIYKGDLMNGGYASNLSEMILDTKPSFWVHGHTHTSFNYMIGNTNVICNPRGYVGHPDQNPNFNVNASFEV